MHIVHIAAELAPVAKAGGLGDVVLGLNRELVAHGNDVEVILPKYDVTEWDQVEGLKVIEENLMSFYDGQLHRNTIWSGMVLGLPVFFIEPHHPDNFFERECFYGCEDDAARFLYFSRAALQFLEDRGRSPDIIHHHDWHTAAVGLLFKEVYAKRGKLNSSLVLTVHNFQYQGQCGATEFDRLGLDGSAMLSNDKAKDDNYDNCINLLKGGIAYADFITTVSPRHATEVMTPKDGHGLDAAIRKYDYKFTGILNGLDYGYWNPETDPMLPANFSHRVQPAHDDDIITLPQKSLCKKMLRIKCGLADTHRPIVGCVARLVPQKGVHLIKHAIERTLELNGQFVLLGSSPIDSIQKDFHGLKNRMSSNPNVHMHLQHREDLVHLIFGGSDMFIVPSLFEPCGLTQLIALRHGTVPIVRHTGGLADTIIDVDAPNVAFDQANGYSFITPDAVGVNSALDRAIKCWYNTPDRWRRLAINGMKMNFSWAQSAKKYLDIYESVAETVTV